MKMLAYLIAAAAAVAAGLGAAAFLKNRKEPEQEAYYV